MKYLFLTVVIDPFTLFFLYTCIQVMLTFILINVRYLKNVVFSFEKGLNGQNQCKFKKTKQKIPGQLHPVTHQNAR